MTRAQLPTPRVVAALAATAALALAGCPGQKKIQVGAVLPLSGQWEVYGESIQKGIDIAAERTRANTELKVAVELVQPIRDSQSQPAKAAEEAEALYDDGVMAVIGGVTTDEALAMVPISDEADRVLLSPSASSPRLTGISKNFYRVYPSDFREGSKMGNFAAQGLELKKVVILAAKSPYARGIQDVFKSEFERYGGTVAAVIEYPEGHTDFADDVRQALALAPEAVYVADYAFEIGSIVQELRRQGFPGRILTTHAFASPAIYGSIGANAEGVLLTQTVFDVNSQEPHVKAFVEAYRARHKSDPDTFAAHGYDAFMTVVDAAQRGGGTLASDFWKGMRQVNFDSASGHIQFDEKGDVGQFPRVYAIENGKLVDFEKLVEERKAEIRKRLEELQREAMRQRAAGN